MLIKDQAVALLTDVLRQTKDQPMMLVAASCIWQYITLDI